MTYSLDFREKVLSVRKKENLTFAQVSTRFSVGIASVVRWSKRLHPKVTRNKSSTKIDMEALQKDVIDNPDDYQYERANRFNVSKTGIWHALKRLGVSYKKNFNTSQSRRRKAFII